MNEVCATANIYSALRRALRSHSSLLVIVSMYVGVCFTLTRIYGIGTNFIVSSLGQFFFITIFYAIIYLIYVLLYLHPERPITHINFKFRHLSLERIFSFLLAVVAVSVLMASFTYAKSMIPLINPFSWDATFARWDSALHGCDAWKIVHPFLSVPMITRLLVVVYSAYFIIVLPIVPWYAAKANSKRRMQFLLTFVLCWILLGTVAAIIFSSAGPCFYENITGSDRYAELMAYLNDAPAKFLTNSQRSLWYRYENRESNYLFAISAMPSMHVALTFLLVLVSQSRLTRALSSIFTVLVALGCVHFGWHYAIDIYAGIIGTLLIWWIVGLCLHGRLPFSRCLTQRELR